jgi:hypothetical protein
MVISAILALLSLVGLILTFTSGLLTSGVDGLFLVIVCLATALIFGLQALSEAARMGLLPQRFRKAHR